MLLSSFMAATIACNGSVASAKGATPQTAPEKSSSGRLEASCRDGLALRSVTRVKSRVIMVPGLLWNHDSTYSTL